MFYGHASGILSSQHFLKAFLLTFALGWALDVLGLLTRVL